MIDDALLAEAIAYAKTQERLSVSALQRRFSIGFNRASRLKEALQEHGLPMDEPAIPSSPTPVVKKNVNADPQSIQIKVLLADHEAQLHFAEQAPSDLAYFTFDEKLQPEDLSADLLFVVGQFDHIEAQQAVEFCRQATTSLILAIQLGQTDGHWTDCTIKKRENQSPAAIIDAITQMLKSNLIHIDLENFLMCFDGFCGHLIEAQAEGESSVMPCYQALLAQIETNRPIEGLILLINNAELRLDEASQIYFMLEELLDTDFCVLALNENTQSDHVCSMHAFMMTEHGLPMDEPAIPSSPTPVMKKNVNADPQSIQIKVLLADHEAQLHFAEQTPSDLAYFTFDEKLQPEDLSADLLFVVGQFDHIEAQQAVEFCRQATTSLILAIQLGQTEGNWADCTIKKRENQSPAAIIDAITQMLKSNLIHIDLEDFLLMRFDGVCAHLIEAQIEGESPIMSCYQALLAQIETNRPIKRLILLINHAELRLDEVSQIQSMLLEKLSDTGFYLLALNENTQSNHVCSMHALIIYYA